MLASTVLFACMHVTVRLASETIEPFEIVFFRNLFGFVALTPFLIRYGMGLFRTSRVGTHAFRSVLNVVAMGAFFYALSMSPMARVQALTFTAPIFTMLLAAVLLKERIRNDQWIAVFVAFIGALFIVRPGVSSIDPGTLLVLASSFVWAMTMIVIKKLSDTESAPTITAWMVVFMSIFSLPAALSVWKTPSGIEWVYLIAAGILGTFAQMLLTQSFRVAPASLVLPFDFAKVIWGATLAWFLFAEVVQFWTWIGAVLIFATATWITLREKRLAASRQ